MELKLWNNMKTLQYYNNKTLQYNKIHYNK